jgi:anti-anti-sigma factor
LTIYGVRSETGRRQSPSVGVAYDPPDEPRFAAIGYLRGEHDLATSPAVAGAIGSVSGSVLIDLSDCDFIDSTIIRTLADRSRSIVTDGSILEIVAVPGGNVARTLELVRLGQLLPIHATRPTPQPERLVED